uniref:Uncharacterized protein n=1 Tax=Davidia involucrata TaxID=16924 RepID=A0A5B6YNB8_DAVIN
MVQVEAKDRGLALSVISNHLSASSSLSSISLVLSSLIGAWIGNTSDNNIFTNSLIYGDTSPSIVSVKYMSLLACFMTAFACFVQSTRCFVHANFLVTMPNADIPVTYIEHSLIRGTNFWSVGMRALYFASNLIMWIFGPIPMFVSSVVMVSLLHQVDTNSIPLHDFQPPATAGRGLFAKIGEEITTITTSVFERDERPQQGIEMRPTPMPKPTLTGGVNDQSQQQLQEQALNNQSLQLQAMSNPTQAAVSNSGTATQ